MLQQIEGSRAVAETVALCRPEVICAYPISPQTHIVEALSGLVKGGSLAPCEFVNVESEFAAMSVAIGASAAGARAYTATASQGLLYMAEAVYNASGLGLPIVMTVANRAIGAPINIWNDHSDAMSQRVCGWIQLYAETNQEAADLHIQAFRIAEELSTVAELRDLEYKVQRAMRFRGARYLHVLVPCPLGWGSAAKDTVRISRLAKETGLFPVFEAERGELVNSSKIRRQLPVEEYLRPQARYAHLFGEHSRTEVIAQIQAIADRNIRRFDLLDTKSIEPKGPR